MELACRNLFVYGSLRSGFNNPAYAYISKYFTLVGHAFVKGKLYQLPQFPAGVPSDENHLISGELYSIKVPSECSWAFAQLDDYEGVQAEEGQVPLYKRVLTTVQIEGREEQAWIYWYNGSVENGVFIEGGDLLAYLTQNGQL
ncbi:MAG: gamma-glutamylcyclotransferase family protein [Sediminibacterium sp.]|jgi:gamma-glutamylcyclotransferase (GGCT)/AIG2-like uncharacterized protein YtfP